MGHVDNYLYEIRTNYCNSYKSETYFLRISLLIPTIFYDIRFPVFVLPFRVSALVLGDCIISATLTILKTVASTQFSL